jgi:nickel-dependent lactate racemase
VSVIEAIENAHEGLLDLFFGEPEATHAKTIEYWRGNFGINISGKVEKIIFGCGGEAHDETLTSALAHAFFNIAQNAVLDSGKLCMLAECSKGLGSEALLRFVTGRFTPTANLDQLQYFDGLEVLLSFFRVQKELELSLVSSLPKYYGEKFGFKTYSGAREAPGSIVAQGSRAKILVIPDAACCSVSLPENLGL